MKDLGTSNYMLYELEIKEGVRRYAISHITSPKEGAKRGKCSSHRK